ncbi:conserved hypothetical protein [Vibrio chagasii]|nr:conserved hypothetical protein [Vibrio chagasii]
MREIPESGFICFNEANDSEGEMWSRFVNVDDPNLLSLVELVNKITSLGGEGDSPYTFDIDSDGEYEVYENGEILVLIHSTEGKTSYAEHMSYAEIGELDVSATDFESVDSQLYKLSWVKR